MRKTLLSVLAGLTVFGATFAAPTPEDRKALCERHPDKYVWVEKTKACVPINPCAASENKDVREAYCSDLLVPAESRKRDLVIDRYLSKVLKTSVASMTSFGAEYHGDTLANYHAVKTLDGGYIVFPELVPNGYLDLDSDIFILAAETYGFDYNVTFGKVGGPGVRVEVRASKSECQDIFDFASLLADHMISGYEYNEEGWCAVQD